ncbi:hypothetical protein [Pseudomonas sp. RC2C2]|uniref:hypothetical protein n=1 Tax=Pseudomonas sp. RC2C2 TaxID=2834408 RepID=UPI001BCB49A1|nr:hypothetical protein [Pseudomonas sp. RC2C2]MBS7596717.1 hypothetical protein [Pseudomonas sp. RC2C2]
MSTPPHTDVNSHIDRHNESQEKVVARAQDLVKTLLLLSGGALAVCANFFSAKVVFPVTTVIPVQLAWVFLTAAIILFGVVLTLLLGRDYVFGEIVGRQMEAWKNGKPDPDEGDPSKLWDWGMWGAGLLGLLAFATGMGCFTYAAWIFLNTQIPMIS